jgi:DNA-binding CsgD family transcriptional regulator
MSMPNSGIAERALDALDLPLLAVDRGQRIVFSNASAEELLQGGRCLFRSNGRLAGRDAATNDALEGLVASSRGARRLCARSAHGGEAAEIYALAVPFAERQHLLLLVDRRGVGLDTDRIAQLFDLTPAEARLARALVSGRTLSEYAGEGGISLHTVRSHLRQVLDKAGMRRQADLVRALAGLPSLRT